MSCAAEMRVRKSDDLTVVVLITRTVFIRIFIIFTADVVRLLVGVRRELDRPEWNGRARKCMTHSLSADKWIDIFRGHLSKHGYYWGGERYDHSCGKYSFHNFEKVKGLSSSYDTKSCGVVGIGRFRL